MPLKVSDASFQADVLDAKKPVLVDFWAEWCGPCRMIAPALDELSTELGDKVIIAKLNIDENPRLAQIEDQGMDRELHLGVLGQHLPRKVQ